MGLFKVLFRVIVAQPPKAPPRRTDRPAPKPKLVAEPRVLERTQSPIAPLKAPPPGKRRHPCREERAVMAQKVNARAVRDGGTVLKGKCWVIDGDTIVIKYIHIRLAGIDAPELDQPWGKKAKWAVHALCKGQEISAHVTEEMSHDRVVARCFLPDGRDIAAELVKQGLALDWPLYSGGRYACYEPADARKRLWRAHRRQGQNRPG